MSLEPRKLSLLYISRMFLWGLSWGSQQRDLLMAKKPMEKIVKLLSLSGSGEERESLSF